jgi:uncharacterized protein YndB with AHSA1/START domain
MLKKIVVAVIVLVAGLCAFAATKPDTFRVQRSTTIKASPEKVASLISDFHKWPAWSPWEKLDPAMKRDISGAPSGKGAVYAWEGNRKAGAGRMEITDVSPSKVTIKLDFLKPMKSNNTVDFTLQPEGGATPATNVTWVMNGPMPFTGKVMCLFFDMDEMVGKDFEAGLANLKAAAEK